MPLLKPDEMLVQTHYSAISAGTEGMIYRGEFSGGCAADTSIASLDQPMRYPLKYGYACVGQIIEVGADVDQKLLGRTTFAFNPHETHFTLHHASFTPIDFDPKVGTLLPNMETAVSFVMDGRPVIGERVLLLGQGIVGLLTTMLLAQFPLAELTTVDLNPHRRAQSMAMGAHHAMSLDGVDMADYDLIYELSGDPNMFSVAIDKCGYNGRVIVGSWYGAKMGMMQFSDHFHRNHVQLVSSQVSTLHPQWRGRWSKQRRFGFARKWLEEQLPAALITDTIPFNQADHAWELLTQTSSSTVQVVLAYDDRNRT